MMNIKSFKHFRAKPGKTIHRSRVFSLKQVNILAPDGRKFQHDIIFHPGAAVVIPMTKEGRFVMIKQFRPAVQKAIYEFPAGTLEDGESPIVCARREIIEETGYQAARWDKLGSFHPAPGVSTELMHLYLARDLTAAAAPGDSDEFLRREIISFSRLQKWIFQSRILDGKTLVGFFLYCRWKRRHK